jgi:acetyltransferase-like isoleucine patch superfamily enzyme
MTASVLLPHDWFPHPLPDNVSIGEGSWLYSSYSFAHCRSRRHTAVRIGSRSGVYNGCFFDLGPAGEVEVGDYCTLVGVVFATNGRVRIGSYSFLAHEVVIADAPAAAPWRAPDTEGPVAEPDDCVVIGENVWIGAKTVLLKGARLGDDSVVGAGTVVDFGVPPRAIVGGNPARIVGWAKRQS